MSKAVVGGPFLRIAEDTVGLRCFLETLLRLVIVRIAVRMVFQREFTVGGFQARLVYLARYSQYFVVIPFRSVHFFSTATLTIAGRSSLPLKLYPRWYSSITV